MTNPKPYQHMKKTLLSLLTLLVCGLTASALSTKNAWIVPSNDEAPTSEASALTRELPTGQAKANNAK